MIADFKAFDILPPDVNNKIHIRPEFFRRRIVSDGFYQPEIDTESIFNDFLPITSRSGRQHPCMGVIPIKIRKKIPNQRHRVPRIWKIA